MYLIDAQTPEEKFEHLRKAADRLRWHSLEATSIAGSGHPTSSLSCAEIMSVLFFEQMRMDSHEPYNMHNDRFILSKGHAAPVLWSVYYEAGLIDRDELCSLRQIESRVEGHPTPRNPWVDVATGSLGQGLSMGLGMAWSARSRSAQNRIYVLLGDGETAEGSVWEAAALASHLKLGNLTAVVDINRYGQSEATMLGTRVTAYEKRFKAFGWKTLKVDGHDVEALSDAFNQARLAGEPCVILARTKKGKGVSFLEGKKGSHGKTVESVEKAVKELDPQAMVEERALRIHRVEKSEAMPVPEVERTLSRGKYKAGEEVATRKAFGKAMLELAGMYPQLVALDGDVKNSTGLEDFFKKYPDRSIECFIAEQNMVGMAVGLSKSGWHPCVATFAAFLTRAFDQLRMAVISQSQLIVAGSHAGVAIGEDGPSQMGLEDIAMMRSLSGSLVLYPADAVSTFALLELAARHEGISYLRLTRGASRVVYSADTEFIPGGCHVWNESEYDVITLIGAGVTFYECLKAQAQLKEEGIRARVIDCYSIKPIDVDTICQCAMDTGCLVVVEDHYSEGGLGEAVKSAITCIPCVLWHLAVRGVSKSGAPEELLDYHKISHVQICEAARKADQILRCESENSVRGQI